MGTFSLYMENRKLLPLFTEVAELISTDIGAAIACCEKLSETDVKKSHIYDAIVQNLNEIDYAQLRADAEKEIKDKQAKKAAAAAAFASEPKSEPKSVAAPAPVAPPRPSLPMTPLELVRMLRHIGSKLTSLKDNGHISDDYAKAISAMIFELGNADKSTSLTPEDHAAKEQQRQAATLAIKKKQDDAKDLENHMEIVKTLKGEGGLDDDISDAETIAAYEEIYSTLSKIEDDPLKHLNFWIGARKLAGHRVSDEVVAVMRAVKHLGRLPIPGEHVHVDQPVEDEDLEEAEDLFKTPTKVILNKDNKETFLNAIANSVQDESKYAPLQKDVEMLVDHVCELIKSGHLVDKEMIRDMFSGTWGATPKQINVSAYKNQLRDVFLAVIRAINNKKNESVSSREIGLQEQADHSRMLRVLAGLIK
jgi:hypothetical protein